MSLFRLSCCIFTALSLSVASTAVAEVTAPESSPPAPVFTADAHWVNGEPLSWEGLRGQVVLVNFWTFACWNCYRSFPLLSSLQAGLAGEDFRVVGVHSPEFDYEKQRERLLTKISQYKLTHPILVDNNHDYWKAVGNRYWPAFYLIGKQGRIRSLYVGEMHADTDDARALEADIQTLLAESY